MNTTSAIAPSPPLDVVASAAGPDELTWHWSAPTDLGGTPVTVYRLCVAVANAAAFSECEVELEVANTTAVSVGLNASTAYEAAVYVVSRWAGSPWWENAIMV